MRAALVEQYGRPPVIGELAEPQRGQGQVLVELIAAPLNPVDLRIASGSFSRGSPPLPYVPGVEGVGRVVEGDRLALGERVYFGGGGALAERVAIAQDATVSLPEGLEEALAASLGVAGLAAWLALEWRAKLAPGENVLVLGASGAVGQIAVQAARVLKAGRVVAAGRNPAALERALELGADATVALSGDREAFARSLREAAGGDGYDVVVDPLWGDPAAAALDAVKAYGRLVQVGESAGAEATLT
ncbi:MAG TPA: zinc-binding dehydrogenase, partial [Solirubrobacteraceae bacterium]|nr:zinc-binding dehydrogenase [Solirubrobacteraceae bacterium]